MAESSVLDRGFSGFRGIRSTSLQPELWFSKVYCISTKEGAESAAPTACPWLWGKFGGPLSRHQTPHLCTQECISHGKCAQSLGLEAWPEEAEAGLTGDDRSAKSAGP